MKILCPTDFSPRSREAARIALGIAQRASGSVELVHVLSSRAAELVALGAPVASLDNLLWQEGQAKLDGECRELGAAGVSVTSWLGEGDPASTMLARARATGADLIVMGAHGRPALERFILGSTAERTVRRADRPVLVVPPGVDPSEWVSDGKGVLQVVVAVDGRPGSRGALQFVRALRALMACDVTFLRLYWPLEEYARLGLTGPRDLFRPDPEITANLARALAKDVGALPGVGAVSLVVEAAWGEPSAAILDFARARRSDLVVMGTESRHGFARIAHPPVAAGVARRASGVAVVFAPPAGDETAAEVAPISTVLAATDLSAEGNRAARFAHTLVAARGGVVELCHVHERPLPSPPYAYDRPQGKLGEAERSRVMAELRALVPPQTEGQGVTTHLTLIDGGEAGLAIVQASERLAVDAIVVGSHGRAGAARALLGSVSETVVRHAQRPVVVVPRSREMVS